MAYVDAPLVKILSDVYRRGKSHPTPYFFHS